MSKLRVTPLTISERTFLNRLNSACDSGDIEELEARRLFRLHQRCLNSELTEALIRYRSMGIDLIGPRYDPPSRTAKQ